MEAAGICAHHKTDGHPSPSAYLSHSHDSYELFLLLSGSCDFQVAESRYRPAQGAVLLLRCGEPHRLLVNDGAPLEYLCAQFTQESLPAEPSLRKVVQALFDDREQGTLNLWQLNEPSLDFLQTGMRRLAAITTGDVRDLFLTYIRPILRELFLYGTPLSGEPCDVRRDDSRGAVLFEQVAEYISGHLAEIKDLRFISEVFHYSTVYVNRLFRTKVGVPTWQYVLHKRIDRACDLMLDGMRAEQAALACGFEDYSTFYRVFRKSYGITPSACKRAGVKPRLVRRESEANGEDTIEDGRDTSVNLG